SVTVGIDEPDSMVAAARRHLDRGFRILKVKIGENAAQDIMCLRMIRDAAGPDIIIRVDANEGYTATDAIEVARRLEDLDIELFEQPVAADRPDDLRRVGAATRAPVLADEAVKVAGDLAPLVRSGAASGANIKLMKCGGLGEARRIDAGLSQAGWRALVGCMDESRASISAAAHFAASAPSVAWIDLDGHLDLAGDPFGGGFEIRDGEIVLDDKPGLGVLFEGFR
ncbi:MAG TPA: enolase C-terminal domain-like protein, partial [Patescibacteria group bacterium]|nr:enolase C-terminal domain-like protein [Patescibacteria group bacterium]